MNAFASDQAEEKNTMQAIWNWLDFMDASMFVTLQDISQQLASISSDFHNHVTQCYDFIPLKLLEF